MAVIEERWVDFKLESHPKSHSRRSGVMGHQQQYLIPLCLMYASWVKKN
jgi:hypothetical protein